MYERLWKTNWNRINLWDSRDKIESSHVLQRCQRWSRNGAVRLLEVKVKKENGQHNHGLCCPWGKCKAKWQQQNTIFIQGKSHFIWHNFGSVTQFSFPAGGLGPHEQMLRSRHTYGHLYLLQIHRSLGGKQTIVLQAWMAAWVWVLNFQILSLWWISPILLHMA